MNAQEEPKEEFVVKLSEHQELLAICKAIGKLHTEHSSKVQEVNNHYQGLLNIDFEKFKEYLRSKNLFEDKFNYKIYLEDDKVVRMPFFTTKELQQEISNKKEINNDLKKTEEPKMAKVVKKAAKKATKKATKKVAKKK